MNLTKILVPYEGSYLADKAFDYAIDLANVNSLEKSNTDSNKLKTEILLLHVVPEIPIANLLSELPVRRKKGKRLGNLSDYIRELYQQMEEQMMEILEHKKRKCNVDTASAQIRIITVVGSPSNKIVDIANDEKVDLIIIGSNGLKGISKLFRGLGMVARTVSERASCTVVIIR